MAWVKVSKLCLPKEDGGLAIKNLEIFNLAVLGKWRRRLVCDEENVWYNFNHRYYGQNRMLEGKYYSVWRKDLKKIDMCDPQVHGWFDDVIR